MSRGIRQVTKRTSGICRLIGVNRVEEIASEQRKVKYHQERQEQIKREGKYNLSNSK